MPETAPQAAPNRPSPLDGLIRPFRLADLKFACFIFCLVPVQTLFAYNWLVLPQYVNRAFAGTWVGDRFETAISLNALLVFLLCPVVAALTVRTRVYSIPAPIPGSPARRRWLPPAGASSGGSACAPRGSPPAPRRPGSRS